MNEALTINGDGAQRNLDIHWPKGQHPEDADLYAHNEIMVNASCETDSIAPPRRRPLEPRPVSPRSGVPRINPISRQAWPTMVPENSRFPSIFPMKSTYGEESAAA